jgi:hypothetical protein
MYLSAKRFEFRGIRKSVIKFVLEAAEGISHDVPNWRKAS